MPAASRDDAGDSDATNQTSNVGVCKTKTLR